jgi:hypothetical protein
LGVGDALVFYVSKTVGDSVEYGRFVGKSHDKVDIWKDKAESAMGAGVLNPALSSYSTIHLFVTTTIALF